MKTKTNASASAVQRLIGRKIYYGFNVHTITAHNVYEQNDGSYVTALAVKNGNWFMFSGIDPFGARSEVKLLDFCKFDINRKRGVITAIVGWKGRTYAGTAVYNSKDPFDPTFGRQLALYRALVNPSATAADVERLGVVGSDGDDREDNDLVSEPNEPTDEANEPTSKANDPANEVDEPSHEVDEPSHEANDVNDTANVGCP